MNEEGEQRVMTEALREKVKNKKKFKKKRKKKKSISSNFLSLVKFEMSPTCKSLWSAEGRETLSLEREAERGNRNAQREGCECGKSNFCAQ